MQVGPTNYSGRSRVVLFDNQDPNGLTLYTGGVTGGVFKSINKGLTWNAASPASSEILRVSSMTQTPGGVIYVGTGEYYCEDGEFMGTGLYKSDNGMDFTLVDGTKPTLNDPLSNWAYILKLACDPNSGRLFAATNAGIKYSDDGKTWTDLIFGMAIDVTVGPNGTVLFVVDNHVYIAEGGDLGNITDVSTGEEDMLPTDNAGWTSLAIAPSDPSVMYASIAKLSDSYLLGIYRSDDNGATWSLIFPPNNTYEPFFGNGCYSNTIEVFPTDPDAILLEDPVPGMVKNTNQLDISTGSRSLLASLPPADRLPPVTTTIMHSVPTPQMNLRLQHPTEFQPGYLTESRLLSKQQIKILQQHSSTRLLCRGSTTGSWEAVFVLGQRSSTLFPKIPQPMAMFLQPLSVRGHSVNGRSFNRTTSSSPEPDFTQMVYLMFVPKTSVKQQPSASWEVLPAPFQVTYPQRCGKPQTSPTHRIHYGFMPVREPSMLTPLLSWRA